MQAAVEADRQAQDEAETFGGLGGGMGHHGGPNTFITVRRDRVLEDSFQQLNPLGPGLKVGLPQF